jgi:hypothetical protein
MSQTRRFAALVAVLAGAVAPGGGCGEDRAVDWGSRVAGLDVSLVETARGASDAPLPIPDPNNGETVHYTIAIQVQGAGAGQPAFDGWVRVSSRPGTATVDAGSPDAIANDVHVRAGATTTVGVSLSSVFGPTTVWAEDIGYLPHQGSGWPACSDGIDNDGDGTADFAGVRALCKTDLDCTGGAICCATYGANVCADAARCQYEKAHPEDQYWYYKYPPDIGCVDGTDDSETPGTGIAGVSETLWFDTPTIAQVQGPGRDSPYVGQSIMVTRGTDIVTRISTDGMFVTDIADTTGFNTSIFLYNFETPDNMRVCDRLTQFTGNLGDFYGFTEVDFPDWQSSWWDPRAAPTCPVPAAHTLAPAEILDPAQMQKWESALVRIENVAMSDTPRSCDLDGNGTVDYTVPAENDCQNACDADWKCTEAVNYAGYHQFAVGVGDPATTTPVKILINSYGTIAQFDPFGTWRQSITDPARGLAIDPAHPDTLRSITGTVRVWRGGPRVLWAIEPRCPDDLCGPDSACGGDRCCTGDPIETNVACVYPRTGDEIDEQQ